MTKTSQYKDFCICIDLDDTLYNEIEYVISGYKFIEKWIYDNNNKISFKIKKETIQNNINSHIQIFIKKNNLPERYIDYFVKILRDHKPIIELSRNNLEKLRKLKDKFKNLILLTNGRSISQRNKIESLKITEFFNDILISEEIGANKPDEKLYQKIIKKYKDHNILFVGDNIDVDLVTPIHLGYKTLLIKNIKNRIHNYDNNHPDFKNISLIYDEFHHIDDSDIIKLYY